MQKENTNINMDVYKKLICDMILDIQDGAFLRQIYSIIAREDKKTGR